MENFSNFNQLKKSKLFNKYFTNEKKYFTIVFFIFLLILGFGFYSPHIENKIKNNWKDDLELKIENIINESVNIFNNKNDLIVNVSNEIKEKIRYELLKKETNYKKILDIILREKYNKYSIQVFSNTRQIIAWNNKNIYKAEDLEKVPFKKGETFFKQMVLYEYLSVIDTIKLSNSSFYITVNYPIEKNYDIKSVDNSILSLTQRLSEQFETGFDIQYFPYAIHTKDGRKVSFDFLNNKGNKIGVVTFVKPFLDTTVKNIKENIFAIQSILILFGVLFLLLAFKFDFNRIESKLLKLFLLFIFLIGTRYILFYSGLTLIIIKGSITEASNFASTFGGGIVKSPLEYFITNLFLIPLVLTGWKYFHEYINSSTRLTYNKKLNIVFASVLLIVSFPILRALASAIKSVVYDSTIKYFDEINLFPSSEVFLMLLNILLSSFILISFLILILKLIELLLKPFLKKNIHYFILYSIYILFGLSYFHFQLEPLLNFTWVLISFVLIVLTSFYLKNNFKNIKYVFIIISLTASILSINYLIYFNSKFEHSLLKTISLDLNRPNEVLLEFIMTETLQNISTDDNVVKFLSSNKNEGNKLAFLMWNKSKLFKEKLQSNIVILNKEKNVVGYFSIEDNNQNNFPLEIFENKIDSINIFNYELLNEKYLAGITPVLQRGIIIGYVYCSVLIEKLPGYNSKIPDFLLNENTSGIYSYLPSEIVIYKIVENEIIDFYGNVFPTREKLLEIINNKFNSEGEVWFSINMDNENFLAYSKKSEIENQTIINTIALRERHLAWNLFNFFKVFFVHFIFILFLLIILLLSDYQKIKQLKFSFRNQLLTVLLLISIIPVFTLAVYNRKVASEKSTIFIKDELKERSDYLINHMNVQRQKNKDRQIQQIFINAGRELGISFAVYESEKLIYHSKEIYYSVGLFSQILNPEVYRKLIYDGNIEYFLQEKLDGFNYDSYYKLIKFDGKEYIIGFNDIFNKLQVSFTTIDIDVFLFGVYSFAILIIIIISSLIANKISAPIRRLTKATESVAHGDFNITIENKEKGEIKDLINGFNQMTKELRRNQTEIAELERESAWKEMAKQVAHEIKNPLTPMKLAMQQLIQSFNDKSDKFNDYFEKISNTILNQIETLNTIASEFSRFARMPKFNLEKFNIIPIIKDSINLFIEEKKKIIFETELQSAITEADASQLRRMLINLIRNSIQADATEIIVKLETIDNYFSIFVIDNGKGIPEDEKNKIFNTNYTTKDKGMGLGLKLSKRFVESIEGKIELIESNSGKTVFKVLLPIKN